MVKPRIRLVPKGGRDHPRWPEVVRFLEEIELSLDPWQMMVLRQSLKRKGGLWAAFSVAVCAARQNGKNGILEAREIIGPTILDERLLIHTAHLADTSLIGFQRLDEMIEDTPALKKRVKHVWRGVGKETIEFRNGNRIRFRTRTGRGGRGFSGSPVFFDEAMDIPESSVASILPVISAQPDPQVWYTGSAVDQQSMQDGMVFSSVRRRALKGEDPRLAYFEWSVDVENPDELEPEVAGDPKQWAKANPALGIRISPEYVKAEMRELDPRSFAVERLGVGDWPAGDRDQGPIDYELWKALEDRGSLMVDPVCLALDTSPDRKWSTISAAGTRPDGLFHVETADRRAGTRWVVPRLAEIVGKQRPARVVADTRGPAASLRQAFEDAHVQIEWIGMREYAEACGLVVDLVADEQVRHLGTPDMAAAVRGAATRPMGDAWAWSRKSSGVDITPLVAGTLAVWAASSDQASVYSERGMIAV